MVDPLSYFSFQPVFHDWCNKGCGMCYPVCGMMHIKQWRRKVPKSGGGGGAHRHVIYVPSVKNQYKRVIFGYMVI